MRCPRAARPLDACVDVRAGLQTMLNEAAAEHRQQLVDVQAEAEKVVKGVEGRIKEAQKEAREQVRKAREEVAEKEADAAKREKKSAALVRQTEEGKQMALRSRDQVRGRAVVVAVWTWSTPI